MAPERVSLPLELLLIALSVGEEYFKETIDFQLSLFVYQYDTQ
jgi:hypothetical protein